MSSTRRSPIESFADTKGEVTDAQTNSLWYEDAVIYQLYVRSFCDSNADGIGDFVGLTQKLDYLQELGITAIWLLPFYPSRLRDDSPCKGKQPTTTGCIISTLPGFQVHHAQLIP
jgi:pullulanase/glycogen debranching enzyme